MSTLTKVTLAKGGTEERVVRAGDIIIPDLWHIAEALIKTGQVADGPGCADSILQCWHLCHDLKRHITDQG